VAAACQGGPLDQVPGRFEVDQRGEPERCAAAAAFDLGERVVGSLLLASDYQYVRAALARANAAALPTPLAESATSAALPFRSVTRCDALSPQNGWRDSA
jgi:hypothetical protein